MTMICRLENDVEEIGKLRSFILTCMNRFGLPTDMEMPVNLALEEAVVNVMQYAFDDGEKHEILVEAGREENLFSLTVTDGGRAFNPFEAPEADTTLDAEQRGIGGLGIHLIRNLADKVTYRRENGQNMLTLFFACKAPAEKEDGVQ